MHLAVRKQHQVSVLIAHLIQETLFTTDYSRLADLGAYRDSPVSASNLSVGVLEYK